METAWKWMILFVALSIGDLCKGFPINLEDNSGGSPQFLTGVAAVLITVGAIILAGCLCCQRRNQGFQEFHNSPVVVSAATNAEHGHVNPLTNGEFTIFRPLQTSTFNNNLGVSNDQVANQILQDLVYGDIDVRLWFESGQSDFPRVKLKYIREIGNGRFGKVVEGAAQNVDPTRTWTPVVVKILDAASSTRDRILFLNDALFYLAPPHPNILALKGRCLSTAPLLLIHESCSGDDLKAKLRAVGSQDWALQWCCQLTSALRHLHDNGFIHPDLAARNCLLTNSLTLKLGDYCLSATKYPEDYYKGGEPLIPVRWRSPESLHCTPTTIQPQKLTQEANVWSLGVVMWEICENGAQPYESLDDDEVVSRVIGPESLRLDGPTKPQLYSDYLFRLMRMCWSTAESRPKVTQIDLMLSDLLQVHKNTQGSSEMAVSDFDKRWESFKPNTIVKTDNHAIDIDSQEIKGAISKPLSPSLNNLHGSLDNLLAEPTRNRLEFKLGILPTRKSDRMFPEASQGQIDSFTDSLIYKQAGSSGSDTEEENWRKKVERGAYSEKVRLKSRSVADLMVLTHVDYSESESETPLPSIDYKLNRSFNRRSNLENSTLNFSSEGNLLSLEDDFQRELKKLQVERRDSLLFVPDNKEGASSNLSLLHEFNSPTEIKPINQIYNIFNVSIKKFDSLGVAGTKLHEIINIEGDEGLAFSRQDSENKSDLGYATLQHSERNSDFGSVDGEQLLEDTHTEIEQKLRNCETNSPAKHQNLPDILASLERDNGKEQLDLLEPNLARDVDDEAVVSSVPKLSDLVLNNHDMTNLVQSQETEESQNVPDLYSENVENSVKPSFISEPALNKSEVLLPEIRQTFVKGPSITELIGSKTGSSAGVASEVETFLYEERKGSDGEEVVALSNNKIVLEEEFEVADDNKGDLKLSLDSEDTYKADLSEINEADTDLSLPVETSPEVESNRSRMGVASEVEPFLFQKRKGFESELCNEEEVVAQSNNTIVLVEEFEKTDDNKDDLKFSLDSENTYKAGLSEINDADIDLSLPIETAPEVESTRSRVGLASEVETFLLEERKGSESSELRNGEEVVAQSNNTIVLVEEFEETDDNKCDLKLSLDSEGTYKADLNEINEAGTDLSLLVETAPEVESVISPNIDFDEDPVKGNSAVDLEALDLLPDNTQAAKTFKENVEIHDEDRAIPLANNELSVEPTPNQRNPFSSKHGFSSESADKSTENKLGVLAFYPKSEKEQQGSQKATNCSIGGSEITVLGKPPREEDTDNLAAAAQLSSTNSSEDLQSEPGNVLEASESTMKKIGKTNSELTQPCHNNLEEAEESRKQEFNKFATKTVYPDSSNLSLKSQESWKKLNSSCTEGLPVSVEELSPSDSGSSLDISSQKPKQQPVETTFTQPPHIAEITSLSSAEDSIVGCDGNQEETEQPPQEVMPETAPLEAQIAPSPAKEDSTTPPKVDFDLSQHQDETKPNFLTHSVVFATSTPFGKKPSLPHSSLPLKGLNLFNDVKHEAEKNMFSSNFMSLEGNRSDVENNLNTSLEADYPEVANTLDYSLETWDNFLGKSFDSSRASNEDFFDSFSAEPQSMIFLDQNERAVEAKQAEAGSTFVKGDGTFVMEDQMNGTLSIKDRTFEIKDKTFEIKNKTFDVEDKADGTFVLESAEEKAAKEKQNSEQWEAGGGWFLHPQSTNDKLTGDIEPQPGSNTSGSYVRFGVDDEVMTAIRKELLEKLPQAQQGASQDGVKEEETWNQAERNEVFLRYNVYNVPLSPIPEESSFDLESDDEELIVTNPKSPKYSESDSEWSEQCQVDLQPASSITNESPGRPENVTHTPSQGSCCSNDTLFNFDDFAEGNKENIPDDDSTARPDSQVLTFEDTYKVEPVEESQDSCEDLVESLSSRSQPGLDAFLSSERSHSASCSLSPFPAKVVAPLPSPEDNPWKSLPASLQTFETISKPNLLTNQSDSEPKSDSTEANGSVVATSAKDVIYDTVAENEGKVAAESPVYENIKNESNNETSGDEDDTLVSLYENDVNGRDYVNVAKQGEVGAEEDMLRILTDIRFSGPIDNQLMSTSFSDSNDVDEQEWESGSDTRSSSSGEFIWKLDDIQPLEGISEETTESDVSTSSSDEEGDNMEFVPYAWDKFATPTKSALRSPEKSLERSELKKSKGVSFKKQKYHCVYEYPREPESPVLQSQDLWKPQIDYVSFTDWEFDADTYLPSPTAESDLNPSTFTYKPTINNSRRSLYYLTSPGDIQGDGASTSRTIADDYVPTPSSQSDPVCSQFFPGASTWIDNVTPDSGLEDSTPCSEGADFGMRTYSAREVVPLKKLAAQVVNRSKKGANDVLGGLRHTRDKLKLDLPPSPSAFTSAKTFAMEPAQDPVTREKPTFSTFGKSRFLVQHVDTPNDDDSQQKKNVCFDVLPYKPLSIVPYNKTFEPLRNEYEMSTFGDKNILNKGEANLLDSADEDSGIESSTLERKTGKLNQEDEEA